MRTSNIDPSKPTTGHAYTAEVRAQLQTAKDELEEVLLTVGSGSPIGSVVPTKVGQEYVDTVTRTFYRCTALDKDVGWVPINFGAGLHCTAFGIYPGSGVNNTAAFATLKNYLKTTSPLFRERIKFGPNDYYFDKIDWNGQNESMGAFAGFYGGFDIEGSGEGFPGFGGCTRLIPNITAEPVFMYNERGLVFGMKMKNITIWGRGASNPDQIGWYIDGQPKTIDDKVGGVRQARISNVFIGNFDGRPLVIKGGITDALSPNDFWHVENLYVDRYSGNHNPGITIIGQFGQATLINCRSGGVGPTSNMGPCWYMGIHPGYDNNIPTSVSSNVFTGQNAHRGYDGEPVRWVPTTGTVPTGYSAGTTYFLVTKNLSTTAQDFALASSKANALAGTIITSTDIGTGCRLVKIWATGLSGDEFTTEFPHLLSTADWVRLVGSSLPTLAGSSITSGDRYWIVWTGFKTFKLASSSANAKTRTTITATGGNVNNYGFQVTDSTFAKGYTSFQPKMIQCTAEGAQVGMFLHGVEGVSIQPYFENLTWGWMVTGHNDFAGLPNVAISDGRIATVTNTIFAEQAQTFCKIDLNSLCFESSGGFFPVNGATIMAINDKQQAIAAAATFSSVNWILGANINIGALTANVTSFAWNANSIKSGFRGIINLVQDATGGRTVALGSGFKGPSIGSGTAGQKCSLPYYFDGTHTLYTSTGWS